VSRRGSKENAMGVATVPLNDGATIPQLGLGVFQMSDEQAEAAVLAAHEVGYRLVDSAAGYENEAGVGRAIARFDRDDIYVTTKLKNDDHGYDEALAAFDLSMRKLGIDTLDLYLVHWPCPRQNRYVETWRALVRLREEGRVRSIGVSNFEPHHLRRIVDETGVVPAVNQVELHPFLQQRKLRSVHAELGVVTEAWSPLGKGGSHLLAHSTVTEIAAEHGATPAQVVLAWHLAEGIVVIPKSVTPSRIMENLGAAELVLGETEVSAISALDSGARLGPRPDDVD
jgi:2,5-diketo-D-gluconate reductase A